MKRILPFLMVLVMSCGLAKAQSSTVIKINPLALPVLTLNIQAEHAFSEKISAQVGFYYGGFRLGTDALGEKVAYHWMGVTPEVRFYVYSPEQAPEGFYIGPYFRYTNWGIDYSANYSYYDSNNNLVTGTGEVNTKVTGIGGGAVFGYQFIFGEHFALDLYMGFGYGSKTAKVTTDFPEDATYSEVDVRGSASGPAVRAGMALGVAF